MTLSQVGAYNTKGFNLIVPAIFYEGTITEAANPKTKSGKKLHESTYSYQNELTEGDLVKIYSSAKYQAVDGNIIVEKADSENDYAIGVVVEEIPDFIGVDSGTSGSRSFSATNDTDSDTTCHREGKVSLFCDQVIAIQAPNAGSNNITAGNWLAYSEGQDGVEKDGLEGNYVGDINVSVKLSGQDIDTGEFLLFMSPVDGTLTGIDYKVSSAVGGSLAGNFGASGGGADFFDAEQDMGDTDLHSNGEAALQNNTLTRGESVYLIISADDGSTDPTEMIMNFRMRPTSPTNNIYAFHGADTNNEYVLCGIGMGGFRLGA